MLILELGIILVGIVTIFVKNATSNGGDASRVGKIKRKDTPPLNNNCTITDAGRVAPIRDSVLCLRYGISCRHSRSNVWRISGSSAIMRRSSANGAALGLSGNHKCK